MATMAAIRAASSVGASLASSSTSPHNTSECRNDSQSCHSTRLCISFRCSGSTFSASPSFSSGVGFSSSTSGSCFSTSHLVSKVARGGRNRDRVSTSPRCESNSSDDGKIPFGYTRKDVIAIGVGLLGVGFAVKFGLEALGVDSIKAGNVVQLTMVLGLTLGWISTYIFRVSSKEMTYAKQLKDYENKVIQKRLDEMPEAELETMLAQVEEEKRILLEKREKRILQENSETLR